MHGSNDHRLVLVAHVDGTITSDISQSLEARQCRVEQTCCAAEASKYCASEKPQVILVDIFLPFAATRGERATDHRATMELVQLARRADSAVQIVGLLNGQVGLSVCCEAVLAGFSGFVDTSSLSFEKDLADRVAQGFARYEKLRQSQSAAPPWKELDVSSVVGISPAWRELLWSLSRTALIGDVPVLIQGQSGTGKQVLAESLHRMDPKRRRKRFATVNCASITGTLAESELFGHCRGAFTGATSDRLGYFRSCDGGTLFLDEISELDMNLQPKLLRALQEGKVLPVGSDKEHSVDVRVVASSNRPLHQMVTDGQFRLDLYQRLKVVSLQVPPLRDRVEDIPLLVGAFLKRYAHYYSGEILSVDPQVYGVLQRARLPGNVRELENIIRQALVLKESGTQLEISDLPEELIEQAAGLGQVEDELIPAEIVGSLGDMLVDGQTSLPELIEFFEKTLISQTIIGWRSTHSELAKRLGLTRRTFYNKLQKYSISPNTIS